MADGIQIGEAYVRIRPNTQGFEKETQQEVEGSLSRIGTGLKTALGGLAVAGFLKAGVEELGSAEKAAAQTAAVLKSTGEAANVTAQDVDSLAESIQNYSGKDKEAIEAAENLLLTFRHVRNEAGEGNDIFNRATELATDLSVAWGQDLNSSAIQLGKALEDPVAGLTALRRVGVQFSEDQQETIKQLVATGDTLEAQKIILAELEVQVGGSAEAYGKTLPGKVEAAKNAFDDLAGSVIAAVGPALEGMLAIVRPLVDGFTALPQPVQTTVVAIAGLAAISSTVRGKLADLAKDGFDKLAVAAFNASGNLAGVGAAAGGIAAVVGASVAAASAVDQLAQAAAKGDFGTFATDIERTDVALKSMGESGAVIGILREQLPGLAAGFKETEAGAAGVSERLLDIGATLGGGIEGAASKFAKAIDDAFDQRSADEFKTQVDAIDKRLVELFNQNPGVAKAAFEQLKLQLIAMGVPAEQVDAAFDDFGAAVSDAGEAAETTATDVDTLTNALTGLFGASLDAEEAAIRTRDAIAHLAEVQASGTATADQLRQAEIDALQAILAQGDAAVDAAAKQAELNGAQLNGTENAYVQKQALEQVAATLAPDSPLRAQLQAYIDQLGNIPGVKETELKINAVINTPGVGPDVFNKIVEQRGLDEALKIFGIVPRAIGGPVTAGQPYRVNEYGRPETFTDTAGNQYLIPTADGRITNDAPSAGGGGLVVQNLNVRVERLSKTGSEITRELERAAFLLGA